MAAYAILSSKADAETGSIRDDLRPETDIGIKGQV